jgi:hypothetical protein
MAIYAGAQRNLSKARVSGDLRLGTLLTRMGLVSEADVLHGLTTSSAARLPLGNILVVRQKLTRTTLRLAIEAQWMIKEGALDEATAKEAVNLGGRSGWNLTDALIALGSDAYPERSTRLGDLLLKTNIIRQAELNEELEVAELTGLPLGRVLVARKRLSEGTVWHAIQLQQQIRMDSLEVDEATERLARINDRLGLSDLKIGELLVAANRLRKKDIEVAAEMAQSNGKQFDQVLIELGWVKPELIHRAQLVDSLLRGNRINYGEAIFFLCDDRRSPHLNNLRNAASQQRLTFYDFLLLNSYLDHAKLKDVVTHLGTDDDLLYGCLQNRPTGDKKYDIKALLCDSAALTQVLNVLYPSDLHSIYCAKAAFMSLQDGTLSAEEALIKYYEVSRGHRTMAAEAR